MPTPPSADDAPQVDVVIVAHDSGRWLRTAVDAVFAQDVACRLVVVDNASRDGSIESLPAHPRLRIARNPHNPGFAVACNQGAALGDAPWLLFLNPDCELPPDGVRRLLEHLRGDARIGLLGAQLLDSDGTPQAASRRHTPRPREAFRLAFARARADAPAHAARLESVEAVSGALMLLPRAGFAALGGFDEGYRLHCEDLDLCRRVLRQGLRVAIAGDVRVPHHKGTSSRARPVWVEWQKHRGMLRYFRKFDAADAPLWLRGAVPLGIALRFPIAAARAWLAARRSLSASG